MIWVWSVRPVSVRESRVLMKQLDGGDGAELGKFCGKLSKKYLANKKMTSTTNKIEINFVAGNNAPKRGFRFKIRAVPMDSQKSVSSKSLLIAPILSNHHSDLTLSKFKNYYQC